MYACKIWNQDSSCFWIYFNFCKKLCDWFSNGISVCETVWPSMAKPLMIFLRYSVSVIFEIFNDNNRHGTLHFYARPWLNSKPILATKRQILMYLVHKFFPIKFIWCRAECYIHEQEQAQNDFCVYIFRCYKWWISSGLSKKYGSFVRKCLKQGLWNFAWWCPLNIALSHTFIDFEITVVVVVAC